MGHEGLFKVGNPGKPKGAISEKTKVWNEIGEWFKSEGMDLYKENLITWMKSGDPEQQDKGMKHFSTLLNYFAPKLSSTELKAKEDKKITINFRDAE